jgi:hypothetical protein
MTATLRDVLNAFDHGATHSMGQIARDLALEPDRLESMLTYWVRKGELREVSFSGKCGGCGISDDCPFVARMPRTYERVRGDDPPPALPACGSGCGCR